MTLNSDLVAFIWTWSAVAWMIFWCRITGQILFLLRFFRAVPSTGCVANWICFFPFFFPVMLCYFSLKGSTDIKPGTSFNLTAQTFGRASVYLLLVVVLPVIDRWHCIQGRAKGHRLLPTISQGPTLIIHLKINLSIYQSTPSRVLCLLFGDWCCGDADTLITRRFVFVSLVNERIIT